MPLPPEPFTIHGGCNCRAIRYKVSVLPANERPIYPTLPRPEGTTQTPEEPPPCTIPFTTWDHCNDCRVATGALLPAWLCTEIEHVSVTCITADSATQSTDTSPTSAQDNLTPAIPAGKFPLQPKDSNINTTSTCTSTIKTISGSALGILSHSTPEILTHTFLRYYKSNTSVTRAFCGRCGTPLSYFYKDLPPSWPVVIDICLGTVDRSDLEKEITGKQVSSYSDADGGGSGNDADGIYQGVLQPERQMFWGWGVPWLRKLVWGLTGPKHETFNLARVVQRVSRDVRQQGLDS